jgi:hypothetical protein
MQSLMPVERPIVCVSIADRAIAARLANGLAAHLGREVRVVTGARDHCRVRIVDSERLSKPLNGEVIIGAGALDSAEIVYLFAKYPWLDHFTTLESLERSGGAHPVARMIRAAVRGGHSSITPFLGQQFHGRKARLRDSSHRMKRIDSVLRLAEKAGAKGSILQKIDDVAEELLTNALYNAPAKRYGKLERTERRVLREEDACVLTYGPSENMFVLRATDPFGSLSRERLVQVLTRCAAGDSVSLDVSSGGAGLGLWRIICAADLVIFRVFANVSTEVLVGVGLKRASRRANSQSVHLLFDASIQPGKTS